MHGHMAKNTQERYVISCQCSGSSLLMKIFAEFPECAVTGSEMMRSAISDGAPPIADRLASHSPAEPETAQQPISDGKAIMIYKLEVGSQILRDAHTYLPSSTPHEVMTARPVFLVRDPIRVFDSWKKRGFTDLKSLVDCFSNLFGLIKDSDSSSASCLLYEQFVQQPRREIDRICSHWGVPYQGFLIEPFTESESPSVCDDVAADPPSDSRALKSLILKDAPCHGLVSNIEKDIIEESVGRLYLDHWHHHLWRLSDVLTERQWIGFDLDDTLHEFRRASSAATNDVLAVMSEKYGVQYAALGKQYKEVLRSSTAHAFSDGKSSSEYRRNRFVAVADHFSLPLKHDNEFLTELLTLYKTTLKESLELKSGAISLLRAIKDQGKKIAVITEGPQDAQEWTIETLGISPYVDFLATTNHFKVSKTDGLFSRVMDTLGISPSEFAYVGDSELRDMVPATKQGIFCLHFAEDKNCNLECYPPRINTLNKLESVLLDHNRRAP